MLTLCVFPAWVWFVFKKRTTESEEGESYPLKREFCGRVTGWEQAGCPSDGFSLLLGSAGKHPVELQENRARQGPPVSTFQSLAKNLWALFCKLMRRKGLIWSEKEEKKVCAK